MKNVITYILGFVLLLLITACSPFNGNPTAKEILKDNINADIFQFNGLIYSNASDLEWVQERSFSKGEEIGEITKTTTKSSKFRDGVASKLPVRTKIYKTVTDSTYTLIVEVEGKEIVYIALLEG